VNGGPYPGARGPSEYWADCALFNGTNDGVREPGGITGLANGKVFSLAVAFKVNVAATADSVLNLDDGGSGWSTHGRLSLNLGAGDATLIQIRGANSSASVILDAASSSASIGTTDWHVVLISIDLTDSGKRNLYVDGVSDYNHTTYTNDTIEMAPTGDVVIGSSLSTNRFDGKIGFFWFDDSYVDFSDETTRLKFFDAFNYPVDLGADGSLPTGSQPLVYLNNDFHLGTNLGSAGNFTDSNPDDGGHVKG
jgi:hypothetical protein